MTRSLRHRQRLLRRLLSTREPCRRRRFRMDTATQPALRQVPRLHTTSTPPAPFAHTTLSTTLRPVIVVQIPNTPKCHLSCETFPLTLRYDCDQSMSLCIVDRPQKDLMHAICSLIFIASYTSLRGPERTSSAHASCRVGSGTGASMGRGASEAGTTTTSGTPVIRPTAGAAAGVDAGAAPMALGEAGAGAGVL